MSTTEKNDHDMTWHDFGFSNGNWSGRYQL